MGDDSVVFVEGECVVFDDSFEHEAWNNSEEERRICLIVDLWHPDLTKQEITLLKFLEKAKMTKVCVTLSVQKYCTLNMLYTLCVLNCILYCIDFLL